MCKIPNVNVGIKWLDFNMRGKFSVMLTDGRQIIVPVSMFPDIKHMSQKHRNEWMILDHQYFTFEHMTRVYSILDIMNINQPAAQFVLPNIGIIRIGRDREQVRVPDSCKAATCFSMVHCPVSCPLWFILLFLPSPLATRG